MKKNDIKAYLKNELFEGIIGKNEYLILKKNNSFDLKNTVLISIHNPDEKIHSEEEVSGFFDVIQIKFWDIEIGIGSNYLPISEEQGSILRKFIEKNKNKKFLIHCSAGQSRSAGVACAVECIVYYEGNNYFYKTGKSDIKKHPRYSPNWVVYDTIISK